MADHRGRSTGSVTTIDCDDSWPIAVSDGVGMPCSDCGEIPHLDYHVSDEFWRAWVPEKPARLSVVCLSCLDRRCGGVGLAAAITEVQWTGTGHTVVLHPVLRYQYRPAAAVSPASPRKDHDESR